MVEANPVGRTLIFRTFLNHIAGRSKACCQNRQETKQDNGFRISGGGQRELGMDVRPGVRLAVRAPGAAGLGTGTQGLVNNGLDGAGAATAFGAAAEATIDLLGVARKTVRGADGTADIVVGQDVTGTDNHTNGGPIGKSEPIDI